MTPIKYMEKQLRKHKRNLERELARCVPIEMIYDIIEKIHCYEAAVEALKKVGDKHGNV